MSDAKESSSISPKRRRKATTIEGRENQLIKLAYDLAEQRLIDGTASAMEITHLLKLKTTETRLREEKLRKENNLLEARVREIESRETTESLYKEALAAMRSYQGEVTQEDEDL